MTLIRIGVMDSSQGNGHMYSFSAIINGLNKNEINQCNFETILSYIKNHVTPVNDIAEIAKVSSIYMEDRSLAERVAKFAQIETVYESESELAINVDAIIVTNDDPNNRNWKIPYLLESGKPIFLDKIIAYSEKEYKSLKALEKFKGQIYSSSAMQYAPVFEKLKLTEEIESLEISVPKSWSLYSVHAIELFLAILKKSEDTADFISFKRLNGTDVAELITNKHKTRVKIKASNISGTPFQAIEQYIDGRQNNLTMNDPFEAFSKMIREFLVSVQTDTYTDKREWDMNVIEIISKGLT